ncbi:transglutaminase [Flavobacterium sp. WLB]|uniref:transglutaminase domain-containing protein n=1 Tax=unclassified Flavobacterium TaxID=196869 RepID=UPI0006ABAA38|nr:MULTISPECIES: transglutaminase domain-containing protein [unclassified Flavobacterium]KOP36646.1 transglutaminase [Flavobacterium sp. VMW]OWU91932.1 transglutaminase [Flavobacterium sp. NLM]PUU70412.1 transglutaminase [Flavobacterium sp. WLB]
MKIKQILFVFFLNIIFLNSTYSQKYTAIDSIVLKYPNFGNTEKLAERIQKDFTLEHDKARAIYSWIAFNLEYDLETYLDPPKPKTFTSKNESENAKQMQLSDANTAQKAFRSKKAVCEGFAQLYAHLSTLCGLKCQVIKGDSKTLLNDIGRRRLGTNHAWNSVQIDGKWVFVDATWGQGYFDEKRQIVVKVFKPFYFDMDPQYFNAKHFPESAMYAGNTGNKEAFLNGPLIYSAFIKEGCEVLMPFSGVIQANDGDKITFKIKNLSRIDDLYYLDKKGERVQIENPKEEDGILEFQVTYNRKCGRFITLYLFRESLMAFKIIPKQI